MDKILVSMPNQLAARLRAVVPARQRSKMIVSLIEKELLKKEHSLYECALAVEKDAALHREMVEWDGVVGDGIDDNESW